MVHMGASRHWPRPAAGLTGHTETLMRVKKNGLVDKSSGLDSTPDTEIKEVKWCRFSLGHLFSV